MTILEDDPKSIEINLAKVSTKSLTAHVYFVENVNRRQYSERAKVVFQEIHLERIPQGIKLTHVHMHGEFILYSTAPKFVAISFFRHGFIDRSRRESFRLG